MGARGRKRNGKRSRNKGARGERQWAKYLRDQGYEDAARGRQFHGGPDSPDVVCPSLPVPHHMEVKRVEQLRLYPALHQATTDAAWATPMVAHRRNQEDWVVILWADDWIGLLSRIAALEEQHAMARAARSPERPPERPGRTGVVSHASRVESPGGEDVVSEPPPFAGAQPSSGEEAQS